MSGPAGGTALVDKPSIMDRRQRRDRKVVMRETTDPEDILGSHSSQSHRVKTQSRSVQKQQSSQRHRQPSNSITQKFTEALFDINLPVEITTDVSSIFLD